MPDFNVFFKYNASYPYDSECTGFLTQTRRGGQITESKSASWNAETTQDLIGYINSFEIGYEDKTTFANHKRTSLRVHSLSIHALLET